MKRVAKVSAVVLLMFIITILLIGIFGQHIHLWLMGPSVFRDDPQTPLSEESIREFREREAAASGDDADVDQADSPIAP